MIHVGKKKHMGYPDKSESKKLINMKYLLDGNGRIFCALKETVLRVYSPKVSGTKMKVVKLIRLFGGGVSLT